MLLTDVLSKFNEKYEQFDDIDNRDTKLPDNSVANYIHDNNNTNVDEHYSEEYIHDNLNRVDKQDLPRFTHDNHIDNFELRKEIKKFEHDNTYESNVDTIEYSNFEHDNNIEYKDINVVNYNHDIKLNTTADVIKSYMHDNNNAEDSKIKNDYVFDNENKYVDSYVLDYSEKPTIIEKKANITNIEGTQVFIKNPDFVINGDYKVDTTGPTSYNKDPDFVEAKADLKSYTNNGTINKIVDSGYSLDQKLEQFKPVSNVRYVTENTPRDILANGTSSMNFNNISSFYPSTTIWDSDVGNAWDNLMGAASNTVEKLVGRATGYFDTVVSTITELPGALVTGVLSYGEGIANNLLSIGTDFLDSLFGGISIPRPLVNTRPRNTFLNSLPRSYSFISWAGSAKIKQNLNNAINADFDRYYKSGIHHILNGENVKHNKRNTTKKEFRKLEYNESPYGHIQNIYKSGLAIDMYWDLELAYHAPRMDDSNTLLSLGLPGLPFNDDWFPAESFTVDGSTLGSKSFQSGDQSFSILTTRKFPSKLSIVVYDNYYRDLERFFSNYYQAINYCDEKHNYTLPYDKQAFDITIYLYYSDRRTCWKKVTYVGIPTFTPQLIGEKQGSAKLKSEYTIEFSIIGLGFDSNYFDTFENHGYFTDMSNIYTSGTGYSTQGFGSEGVVNNYGPAGNAPGTGYSTDGTGSVGVSAEVQASFEAGQAAASSIL